MKFVIVLAVFALICSTMVMAEPLDAAAGHNHELISGAAALNLEHDPNHPNHGAGCWHKTTTTTTTTAAP